MTDEPLGRTTRQMMAAPRDAIFVWPVGRTRDYALDLAKHLGRDDLLITTPENMRRHFEASRRPVILDHGCRLTESQLNDVFHQKRRSGQV